MIRCELTIRRYYLAIAALIATFLIQRPLVNAQWDTATALLAGAADLAILLVLAGTYELVIRISAPESTARSVSGSIHAGLATAILVLAVLSQMLFLKTGEALDFAIIEFGLRHSTELAAVASGEVTLDVLETVLLAIVFVALAAVSVERRSTGYLARAVLILPILLLPGCNIAYSLMNDDADAFVVGRAEGLLYQGAYADLGDTQRSWNRSAQQGWSMGIISGMAFGTTFGRLEYAAYSRKAGSEAIHGISEVTVMDMPARPNVLMILLESVRHDAIGAYRPEGDPAPSVTPFIDAFARGAQIVERAYTTIPHTSKALVGIYCGTFPRFEPEITEGLPGGLGLPCLPELLSKAGYASAHFQTAPAEFESRDQLLRNMRFDHFTTQEDFVDAPWERFGYLGLDDRAMVEPAVKWMLRQQQKGRPFFASLLTIATHHPYAFPGNVKPVADPAQAHRAYREALRYTDTMLQELFISLERSGLLANTLVIITGDHGEGFGEHGQIAHNGTAYEEGMRVPVIIRAPGKDAPVGRIGGLRQHIDLLPTVLEAAGIRVAGAIPGKSLWSTDGHTELITSCFYQDYCLTHVDSSGRKLIYLYGRRGVEMYDLVADPAERKNLFQSDAEMSLIVERQILAAARLRNSYAAVWE